VLSAKDHTVSAKQFQIAECRSCTLRFTQDVPGASSIGPYYKADDYISHTNTSKGLINRLYQWVRKRTLRGKRKLIEKYTGKQKGELLDYGSGVGSFVNEMNSEGWSTMGLEPDPGARLKAKELYDVELGNTTELYTLQEDSFDAITLWHVLEHVHELNACISQLRKVLRPKGKLFIAVPNYTSYDAGIYKENWAAYDVPRHLYHFSPESLERLMVNHGFRVEKFIPMWYDSFYISLLSSRYRNGSSNWISAGWNGLVSNLNALFNSKKCSSVIYVISFN
jgi:2-polyprenyl-3-methyl-5-hydroxy-6-metoxy-1,4-benzoquinol methylase